RAGAGIDGPQHDSGATGARAGPRPRVGGAREGNGRDGVRMLKGRLLAGIVLAIGVGGCVGLRDTPAPITTLDSAGFAMCPWGGDVAGVVDVHDQAGFDAFLARAGLEAPRVAGW